jgi:O-antigen ligase
VSALPATRSAASTAPRILAAPRLQGRICTHPNDIDGPEPHSMDGERLPAESRAVADTASVAATPAAPAVLAPTATERWALRAMQIGAIAVVLVASTDRAFELDRFFVPKELTLHLTALLVGILAAGSFRRARVTWVDAVLGAFLLLGLLSTLTATNGWLAMRALAVSVSGVALFWAARGLAEAGLARPLLQGLGLAVVVGCVTALLQAYGVTSDFFSENRAPGGTLGNRNFIAHMAAFGLPVVLLGALRAWRPAGYLLGTLGTMVVVGTLVLTRSRAGWIAFGVVVLVFLLAMLASRPLRRHARTRLRLAGVLLLMGAGVAAAVLTPNALQWVSDTPYLESARGIVEYREGSGQGRLIQYRQSLGMVTDNPLLGVGPGNWPVAYPEHAAAGDPSMDTRSPGTTWNPWPSSDWIAFVSERGLPAALLLMLALLGLAGAGVRRLLTARDEDEGLVAAALVATVLATITAGMFDAVLLLALPTLLVWAALGALYTPVAGPVTSVRPTRSRLQGAALLVLAVAAAIGAVRSGGQVGAMSIYANDGNAAALERAARLDPGSYRVHLRLARNAPAGSERRCRHARAAHGLFPNAHAARDLAAPCG